MSLKKTAIKNLHKLLIVYFLLWVVLFEFILPVNNILPKPSVVWLSFSALWNDYRLPINFFSTFSAVYLSLLLSYLAAWLLCGFIIKQRHFLQEFFFSIHWFSNYIPWIVIGIILIYWLPASSFVEYIFALLIAFFSIIINLKEESLNVKREYIDAAVSLGMDEKVVAKQVIWKAIQPKMLKHLNLLHFQMWSVLIAFEFIKAGYGLGNIFRIALNYNDLSAIFTISIIIGIVIFLGSQLIKYIKDKFFHWSLI